MTEAARFNAFQEAAISGDLLALDLWREWGEQVYGRLDQYDDLEDWPDFLTEPGNVMQVPRSHALIGYRFWLPDEGGRLIAPAMHTKWNLPLSAPGIVWRRGTNVSTSAYCPIADNVPHPVPGDLRCECGVHALASRNLAHTYARLYRDVISDVAVARVGLFGLVGAFVPGHGYLGTLRASHVVIDGPLDLLPESEHLRESIESRYGIMPGGATIHGTRDGKVSADLVRRITEAGYFDV